MGWGRGGAATFRTGLQFIIFILFVKIDLFFFISLRIFLLFFFKGRYW